MDINDLLDNVKNLEDWEFERRLNSLVRENPRYFNLDEGNKKIIQDIIKKYKYKLRKGIGISGYSITMEKYRLKKNRLKLDLTLEDIKDIEEILDMFRK
ncbi:MAG: hypothetical protein Q8Q23_00570 [bacterium]|nr:hypothetical protein [bacterium]